MRKINFDAVRPSAAHLRANRREKVEIGIISIAFGLAILGFASFVAIKQKRVFRGRGRSGKNWLAEFNPVDHTTQVFSTDSHNLYVLTYFHPKSSNSPLLINSSDAAGQDLIMAAISDFSIVANS